MPNPTIPAAATGLPVIIVPADPLPGMVSRQHSVTGIIMLLAAEDREWSLGSLSGNVSQANWAGGAGGDIEADYAQINLQHVLRDEVEASCQASERLRGIIARLSGVPAGSVVRP